MLPFFFVGFSFAFFVQLWARGHSPLLEVACIPSHMAQSTFRISNDDASSNCYSLPSFLSPAREHSLLLNDFGLDCLFSQSVLSLFATPSTAACLVSLSFTISLNLLKLMSIELVMPSNHLILSHPLLLLPSIFPSIRVFSNESVLHIKRPKYWGFSFSISPSSAYSELISFEIYWFDLLAV